MDDKEMLAKINTIMGKKDSDTWTALVEDIENNDLVWTKGWDGRVGAVVLGGSGNYFPVSGSSGRPYTGFNKLFLMQTLKKIRKSLREINDTGGIAFSENQINDPRFFTFNQIKERKYHLLKGSKSLPIIMWFYHKTDREGKPLPLEEQCWIKKYTNVFHASQIRQAVPALDAEGNKIPLLDAQGNQKMNANGEFLYKMKYVPIPEYTPRFRPYTHEETNELIELLLKKTGASISHDNADENCYMPTMDEIHLTPKEAYKDINDYYRTVLHELSHWTGHASRLNRNLFHKFGTADYAREELRAETAAAFLCCDFNIPLSPNHGAYIKNWLDDLNDKPKELEMAQKDAHRIVNYIHGLIRDKIKALEEIREMPKSEYKDREISAKDEKKKETVQKPETAKKPERKSILSVAVYTPLEGAKWIGKSFDDVLRTKMPVDFAKYRVKDLMVLRNTSKSILESIIAKKGSQDDISLRPGDVIQVADRLFYINKAGRCSNIAENNFYQEIELHRYKDMKIMSPLEGPLREKIKSDQIKLIGQEAFDAYRQQFRDVMYQGSLLKQEDCLHNIEKQYQKFIYDHAFEYGYSGIRPCDLMAWQRADTDFCLKYFAENTELSTSIMEAISIVEKISPFAVGHKNIEYDELLADKISKEPAYKNAKAEKDSWTQSVERGNAASR